MNLPWTLCFIRRGDELLMLLRNNPPNQGLYNGVGGKIEPGELPLASVLREVREETGITLTTARFGGIVTWGGATETGSSGMYVYTAELPPNEDGRLQQFLYTAEGRLSWLRVASVLNLYVSVTVVVDNIPLFLGHMLNGKEPWEHRCHYEGFRLRKVTVHDLADDVIALATATK